MPAKSRTLAVIPLLLALIIQEQPADEPAPGIRPISDADAVLAMYVQDHGLGSRGDAAIIIAAWPDGLIVWSNDRLMGGPPYRAGHVDPKRITALLIRFDKDGLFRDNRLNHANFGPESKFTTLFIQSGKKRTEMSSWHELMEESGESVADHHGVSSLDGRRRLDVLRKAPADYLFYRFVWSESRSRMLDLIPADGTATGGKPVMKRGKLSWQEPIATGPIRQ
jgi:hypothetical protein